jgi:7-alpha-hydroxysteroid dehydrogenase
MSEQEMRLSGRTAIVTGSSRGLGKAIAETFARQGAAVAVVARSETEWSPLHPGTVHDVVKDITDAGGRAIAISADLSRSEDIERLYATARDALGPIDLLINNAALTTPGRPPSPDKKLAPPPPRSSPPERPKPLQLPSFVDMPIKAFKMHFEVGLYAAYRLMQLVLPDMIEAKAGSIVNISSMAAFIPGEGPYQDPNQPIAVSYGANKAALQHLTQSVALEMQVHGIGVNALIPSEPILTPGNLVAASGETNWASPADFAEAALRVATLHPTECTGHLLWSEDVLHPELGRRGWLRTTVRT